MAAAERTIGHSVAVADAEESPSTFVLSFKLKLRQQDMARAIRNRASLVRTEQ